MIMCLVLTLIAVCSATPASRIRRELRGLSPRERHDLSEALWAMKRTSNEDGKLRYGESFWSYDYFTVKHAVAVSDPRGDQGHFGPCFMTYHRAFLLEFEAALLSVLQKLDSTLDALPYWDASLDADTGPLFDTEESVFSSSWFGSYTGNVTEHFVVSDGMFAHWPIATFNASVIPAAFRPNASTIYTGSPMGCLRGANNMVNTSYTTRFPKHFPSLGVHPNIVYTHEDIAVCEDPTLIPDWMSWQACVENAIVFNRAHYPDAFWNNKSGLHWMHSQMHTRIGSYMPPWPEDFPFMSRSTKLWMGDMMDVATSPNDVLFAFHHANVDRINVAWQAATTAAASAAETKFTHATVASRLYGYPTNYTGWQMEWKSRGMPEAVWSSAVDGCKLDDVISSNFPFEAIGDLRPKRGSTLTHRDLLEQTLPSELRYTYDSSSNGRPLDMHKAVLT